MVKIECQKCLLCGHRALTGLHVMGCLLCLSCERKLLRAQAYQVNREKRWSLIRLYRHIAREA